MSYQRRIIDDTLDELFGAGGLRAVAIEGPKGVGKTRTAEQRANTVYRLDDAAVAAVAASDPSMLVAGEPPVLIDEWQRMPVSWDVVRRAVDAGAPGGSFLLAGSAQPVAPPMHSGAGRIVPLRMRPLSVAERSIGTPVVRLRDLLGGERAAIAASTEASAKDYAEEIARSGFPGLRSSKAGALGVELDGYLQRVVEREIPVEAGVTIRSGSALRRWLAAYAAATGTTASWEKIRDAATPGETSKPNRKATVRYKDALDSLFLLDEVPAWLPFGSNLSRLGQAAKHHLADPALAARLLGVSGAQLLRGDGNTLREGALLGALFESLATLSVRVYADACQAQTAHMRTRSGDREIDLIVTGEDGRIVAIEVKLAQVPDEHDLRHLNWLSTKLGDELADMVVLTTGNHAYRRPDGIAVVPLALLGP